MNNTFRNLLFSSNFIALVKKWHHIWGKNPKNLIFSKKNKGFLVSRNYTMSVGLSITRLRILMKNSSNGQWKLFSLSPFLVVFAFTWGFFLLSSSFITLRMRNRLGWLVPDFISGSLWQLANDIQHVFIWLSSLKI
jgi:hypothetical protein